MQVLQTYSLIKDRRLGGKVIVKHGGEKGK